MDGIKRRSVLRAGEPLDATSAHREPGTRTEVSAVVGAPADVLSDAAIGVPDRRDFLHVATGATAAIGAACAAWPLIDSLNPSRDVVAGASIEADLDSIEVGRRLTAVWRDRPVFIAHRTADEIARAAADDRAVLIDPKTDAARAQRPEWLVVVGVCTHLGCIPLGQKTGEPRGDWGGWFCPCHGSHYDTSGRIRKGPAPRNLVVPPYRFLSEARIRLG